ncbi:MAG: phosphate ABC transporter substrate-binding protein PstS, partial [Bryocella sp.]
AGAQDLTGAGASFPNPIYSKWFAEYSATHPGVRINYQSVGSGAGIRQVSQGVVDFGATDSPMTDDQLRASPIKLLHIQTVLGAVVPAYRVPGVNADLHFAPEVIAGIYLGKITRWNDFNIQHDNPGVKLPDHAILPVYRSDGSGTTYVFTDFLSKVVPLFARKIGRNTSVRWPVGIGAKGNEGVAGLVRTTPYSFGYVDLVFAEQNHMQFGLVRNAAFHYVKASVESVSASAAEVAAAMPEDFRTSMTNVGGQGSYPICMYTWLLIPVQSANPAKGRVLHDFVLWMLDRGEAEAPALFYAPLPTAVAAKVRIAAAQIH